MTVQVRDHSKTLQSVREIQIRDNTGNLQTVKMVQIRDNTGTLRTVYNSFGVTASPSFVSGATSSPGNIRITTGAAGVAIVGGVGGFDCSWTTTDTGWAAVNNTAPSTSFRSPPVSNGNTATATFICTVTDLGTGATTVSNAVSCQVDNT